MDSDRYDFAAVGPPHGIAVLLHPHPRFGGDRFHPIVAALFERLPPAGIAAVRFDFSSADPESAIAETVATIDAATNRWPGPPVVLAGYSFGAGIAALVDDTRVAGWYLVAPQVSLLARAMIGPDPRPKALAVPEHDQFSPPDDVQQAVAGWMATTTTTIAGADHYLWDAIASVVDGVVTWVTAQLPR